MYSIARERNALDAQHIAQRHGGAALGCLDQQEAEPMASASAFLQPRPALLQRSW
jgi:hypothetical protein